MKRILFVGVGSIGERHLRCFLETGQVVAGVVEIDADLRGDVCARHGVTESFEGLGDALRVGWDASVVAVPAHLHIPVARQLADAGISLLIEKPLSTTLDGIGELIETVQERHLVAAVAYVYRHHPLVRRMREVLHAGELGRPLELVFVGGQDFSYYRPAYKAVYYARHATGGGALQDALSHQLDMAEWFAGPIDRVLADGQHQHLEGVEVEDTVHLLARQGRILTSFSMNQYQPQSEQTYTAICEKGMLRGELHKNRLSWCGETEGPWHVQHLPPISRDGWFGEQAQAFLDALDGLREPVARLQEAYHTQRVVCTALRQLQSGDGLPPIDSV